MDEINRYLFSGLRSLDPSSFIPPPFFFLRHRFGKETNKGESKLLLRSTYIDSINQPSFYYFVVLPEEEGERAGEKERDESALLSVGNEFWSFLSSRKKKLTVEKKSGTSQHRRDAITMWQYDLREGEEIGGKGGGGERAGKFVKIVVGWSLLIHLVNGCFLLCPAFPAPPPLSTVQRTPIKCVRC